MVPYPPLCYTRAARWPEKRRSRGTRLYHATSKILSLLLWPNQPSELRLFSPTPSTGTSDGYIFYEHVPVSLIQPFAEDAALHYRLYAQLIGLLCSVRNEFAANTLPLIFGI